MGASGRVAVFVADGLEEVEGLTVVDLLFRAKVPCETVSIKEGLDVRSSHGVHLVCDRSICDEGFSFDDYEMLVLPGGMPGTTNLGACEELCDALVAFNAAGKPVSAICAAPTVLATLGILAGRQATCYPDMTGVLEEHGAILAEGSVVTDGNVTTSRGMGTAIDFGLALVRRLKGDAEAERISRAIVYGV